LLPLLPHQHLTALISRASPRLSSYADCFSSYQQAVPLRLSRTYELVDKLVKLYGVERLQTPSDLPREGNISSGNAKTPLWNGYYDEFLAYFQHAEMPKKTLFLKKSNKAKCGGSSHLA